MSRIESDVVRVHPAIVGIGAALGLTEEEIDTLWLDAANT